MSVTVTPCRKKWAGTMTDRERFNRQMHYQSIDRCFNMEFGYWQENYAQWDLFVKNGIKTEAQANEFFAFDQIRGTGGHNWIYPPFPSRVVSETSTMQVVMNGEGLLAEVFKDGQSSIPHFTKASIVTPDDWKRVKEERFNVSHPDRILNVEAIRKAHPDDRAYPLGIGCGSMIGRIRDTLTFEGLCYAVYDYPDMVEDMVETACELTLHSIRQLLPHIRFDYASGWEDICFKNGPIVSVPFFRDIVMPRYKRISKELRKHGVDIWYIDCDGDVRPIMPYFLEGGVNCLFPYEVMGCAHPGELLDQYQGELRIMGGVDKTKMIAGKAEIKAYLESLEKYVAQGGYIPFCDHRCPPDVTVENYLYYLDLKEKMFGMKA